MQIDWGQRATQRHDWCWMQGMRACLHFDADACEPDGALVLWGDRDTFTAFNEDGDEREYRTENATPNMYDAATQGCVLARVRKAWGFRRMTLDVQEDGTTTVTFWGGCGGGLPPLPFVMYKATSPSLEEALVLAWEAAP